MATKLTKTKVDNIQHPKSGQVFYRDSVLTGFGLRVGKSTKAYYAEKRIKGKTRRVTIGDHGQITTEQARREAQKLLGMMATGQNPNEEEKQAQANMAMRVLRAIFNFAIGQYEDSKGNPIIQHNPVTRLSQTRAWYRVERRQTVIKLHELPAFIEGVNQLRDRAITSKTEVVGELPLVATLYRPTATGSGKTKVG